VDPLTHADWKQVEKANPSYPLDTPREAILRMRKKLGPESFLREGLGVWDENGASVYLSEAMWTAVRDPKSRRDGGPVALGVHISGDRATAYIGAVGHRDDGRLHVEIVDITQPSKAVQAIKVLHKRLRCPVAIDPGSHAGSLIQPLEDEGIEVEQATLQKYAAACGTVYDAVKDKHLRHIGQVQLDDCMPPSIRALPRGAWVWDEPALKAVTLAVHGFGLTDSGDGFNIW
jgi:hypothetical protein